MILLLATAARTIADHLHRLAARLEHSAFERKHGREPAMRVGK